MTSLAASSSVYSPERLRGPHSLAMIGEDIGELVRGQIRPLIASHCCSWKPVVQYMARTEPSQYYKSGDPQAFNNNKTRGTSRTSLLPYFPEHAAYPEVTPPATMQAESPQIIMTI